VDLELLIVFGFTFLTTLVVLFTIGGIILLKPLSKHLGQWLEAKAEAGRVLQGRSPEELERMITLMEGVVDRLDRMEERQEFTEKLLAKPKE
jgi:hypothetical protein